MVGVELFAAFAFHHDVGMRSEVPGGVAHRGRPATVSAAGQRAGLENDYSLITTLCASGGLQVAIL